VTRHFPHPHARRVTSALAALCVFSLVACAAPPPPAQPLRPRLTESLVPATPRPPSVTPTPSLRPILDVAPAEESSLVLARRILEERAPALDDLAREGVARALVNAEAEHGLPVLMMLALIEQESRFDPQAVGPRGSLGLMQIRPFVGRDLCKRNGHAWQGERTLYDPVQNVRLGTTFLAELRDAFDDLDLALTAYNMGPTRLRRMLNRGHTPRQTYVRNVQQRYHGLRAAYGDAETAVGG
jgi:soluble lytic murein transglycosylase